MSASAAQINIRQTYGELARAEKSGDFERALKACNRILKATPQDIVAFQCKLVCLIQLSKFDEALQLVRKAANTQDFAFEKAYCEYRLNRTEEAIKTLRAVSSDVTGLDFRCQELMAQLLYRAEHFDECYDIYKNLLKNSQDDFDETRLANLAAVAAQLTMKNPDANLDTAVSSDSFEQCFNEGCRLASSGDFTKAKAMLERAEGACRRSLAEEEATEEEIEEELAGIRVQLAYCMQMMGDTEKAAKLYNDVIKQKPSDLAYLAVASNNLISIRKEQNLFDARKKLKNCTTSQVEQKLNRYQKGVVCLNNALVLLHSNQLEPCRRAIDDLRQRFPSSMETAVLCEAALLARQKDIAGAVDCLKKYIDSSEPNKRRSLVVELALAQMYLLDGQRNRAVERIQSLGDDIRYRPGVVALLVALFLSEDESGRSAMEILAKGVEWYKQSKNAADDPQMPVLVEECASLHARFGDQATATTYLEDLRRMKPDDPVILSRLMNAYVQFNPKKAEEVSRALPPLKGLTHDVDVDGLLNAGWLMLGSKYGAKKATRTAAGATPQPGSADDAGLVKRRKHKKKKKRLPKNYDPNGPPPDPERWLPKYERTAFKKKRDKRQKDRDIGRGTQGAVTGGAELDTAANTHASSPVPTRPPAASSTQAQPGPRQMRPGVQKQKPKKKGKGGNW